jgi:DNA polymerase family B
MAFRKMRYMKENAGNESPTQWVCLDTETKVVANRHVLRLGVAIFWVQKKDRATRREVFHFDTPFQFWLWFGRKLDRKRTTVVIAHNAPFDLTVLDFWFRIECGTIKVKYAAFDSPPFLVSSSIKYSRVMWVDSRNWFRWSLASIGDMLGMPKWDMPAMTASNEVWKAYCQRDTEILEMLMISLLRFVREKDLGVFKFTAASQAFQAYRHRLGLKADFGGLVDSEDGGLKPGGKRGVLPMLHRDENAIGLERDAYYGGYVNCYRLGRVTGPIYSLDINSMYPDLYVRHDYPSRLIEVIHEPSIDTLMSLMAEHLVIARVKVDAKIGEYPYRTDARTLWARGKFWTSLCQPEVYRALSEGAITNIADVAIYDRLSVLRNFGLAFLAMRHEFKASGDCVYESLAKLMGNALHGKFGQRSSHWTIRQGYDTCRQWGQWVTIDADTGKIKRYRAVAGIVQECQDRGESKQSFPALPAFVSSYARESIRRLINVAGVENVYYCCVDGLHVTQEGMDLLIIDGAVHQNLPGKLRLCEVAESATYNGIGHYYLDGIRHVAGIPDRAVERIDGLWEWPRFTSLGDILAHGPDEGIQIHSSCVRLSSLYRHGVCGAQNSVRPYEIGVDKLPE